MNLTKILVAGNSVVDLIFWGKSLQEREKNNRLSLALGGKYVVDEFFQYFGGGGANAAISLSRQGFPVTIWSNLGDDTFARQIVDHLKKEGINSDLIEFKAEKTPISAILLTSEGEKTIITYRSNADLLEFDEKVQEEVTKNDWFALFSLAKCPKEKKLVFLKTAKKSGCKIFLSLHGMEYLKGLDYLKDYLSYCDILHLNAHELADIFGGDAANFNFYKTNFAQKLNLPLLLVTYDIHGNFAYTQGNIYYQPIIKVRKVIDTTGAGDAFASGFLGEYLKTDSIKKALLFGARNASSVIQYLGAQNGLLSS